MGRNPPFDRAEIPTPWSPQLGTVTARRKHFATRCDSFWINALRLSRCSAYAVQTSNPGRLGTPTNGCNSLSVRVLRSSNLEATFAAIN
jgi:hypothetical protein